MRHVLLALLIVAVIPSVLLAQQSSQDPRPSPPVPATIFPIGGLRFGSVVNSLIWNDSLPRFGLNTVNNVESNPSNDLLLPNLTKGLDAWYSDNGLTSYFFGFGEGDFDLASNEQGEAAWDLGANWGEKNGLLTTNNEYSIGVTADDRIVASGGRTDSATYYLSGFNLNPSDLTQQKMKNFSWLNANGATKVEIDFAFWIDQSNSTYASLTGNPTIYDLEVLVTWSDGSYSYTTDGGFTWLNSSELPSSLLEITITKSINSANHDYDKTTWYSQTTWPWAGGNNVDPILSYPSRKLHPSLTSHNYRIKRIEVPNPNPGKLTLKSISIDLKKTDNSFGIFVRGVRIRSNLADNFYQHQYDNTDPDATNQHLSLNHTFQNIHDNLGAAAWRRLRVLKFGNEFGIPNRVLAYLIEYLRSWSKSHFDHHQVDASTLNVGGYETFRSIYEDQSNGVPPPAMQAELGSGNDALYQGVGRRDGDHVYIWPVIPYYTSPMGGSNKPIGPVYPGDAIPSSVKNHTSMIGGVSVRDYQELNTLVTGWNPSGSSGSYDRTDRAAPKPTDWNFSTNSYEGYTAFYQSETAGFAYNGGDFWSEIGSQRIESLYKPASQNCYNSNIPQSLRCAFYAYVPTWGGYSDYSGTIGTALTDDVRSNGVRAKLYDSLKAGHGGSGTTLTWQDVFGPGVVASGQTTYTFSISALSVSGDIVTVTTSTPHNFSVGQVISITSAEPGNTAAGENPGFNGIYTILTTCASQPCSTFTYRDTNPGLPTTTHAGALVTSTLNTGFAMRTKEEIRQCSWDGIAWGAKGIFFNPIGSDNGPNLGFCSSNFETRYPDPTDNGVDWAHKKRIDISDGFSNSNYPFWGLTYEPPNGSIMLPMTLADYGAPTITINGSQITGPQRSSFCRFPDHRVHISGSTNTDPHAGWVPCISDFDIYDGPSNNSSSHLRIHSGEEVRGEVLTGHTNTGVNEYIQALQHYSQSWCIPNATILQQNKLVEADVAAYYARLDVGNWVGQIEAGDATTDWTVWLASDRNLDNNYNSSWSTAQHFSDNPFTDNKSVYDGWPKNTDGCWCGVGIYYPKSGMPVTVSNLPTYYGITERANGVRRVSQDIAPVASILKNLQWRTSFTYSSLAAPHDPATTTPPYDLTKTAWAYAWAQDTAYPLFPFDSNTISSEKMEPYLYPLTPSRSIEFSRSSSTTTTGDETDMLYEFGVFEDPDNDPGAKYIVVVNKRTWPTIYYDTLINNTMTRKIREIDNSTDPPIGTSTEPGYLGAIDARRIYLRLRTDKNVFSANPAFYTISDLRGKSLHKTSDADLIGAQEFVDNVSTPTSFGIDLEPGEGTLLRIAPATGILAGRTERIRYNNGHAVCDILDGDEQVQVSTGIFDICGTIRSRGMVWASKGAVYFAKAPAPGLGQTTLKPESTFVQKIYPSVEVPIASTDSAHDPSIACFVDVPTGRSYVGIVYSIDDYVSRSSGSRKIMFNWSTDGGTTWQSSTDGGQTWLPNTRQIATPGYAYGGPSEITGEGSNVLAPVITPANEGFVIASAYNSSIHSWYLHYMGSGWSMCTLPTLSPGINGWSQNPKFVSIASKRVRRDACSDTFYYAWEGVNGAGGTGIWCEDLIHKWGDICAHACTDCSTEAPDIGPQSWQWCTFSRVEVSTGTQFCRNFHPNITLHPSTNQGESWLKAITWEGYDSAWTEFYPPPQPLWIDHAPTSRVLFREQTQGGFCGAQNWTSLLSLDTEYGNLPLPQVRYEQSLCGENVPGPSVKTYEFVFQDTIQKEALVWRLDRLSGKWDYHRLSDYGQTPSISMPFDPDAQYGSPPQQPGDLGSIMYRGITADENGLYAQKLVANPPQEVPIRARLIPFWYINSKNSSFTTRSCAKYLIVGSDNIKTMMPITPDSVIERTVDWLFKPIGVFETHMLDDTTTALQQVEWPRTEDSARTEYFPVQPGMTIDMKRILFVDSAELNLLLPNASNFISYELLVKDSASGLETQILDSFNIKNSQSLAGGYPGVSPNDTTISGMGYHIYSPILPTPSGVAYITLRILKDTGTQAELLQDQFLGGEITLPVPNIVDSSGAFKRSQPTSPTRLATAPFNIQIHPNPVKDHVLICVDEIPKDYPFFAEVVDAKGAHIATIYDATPEADLGICYRLDCSQLAAGTYYVRVANAIQGSVTKFQIIK